MGYCSVHSHFEFLDTANALPNPDHKNIPDLLRALKAYKNAGYSHVAVTEHGSFSSYEDLRALSKEAGITIIPAIEGYIQEEPYGTEKREKVTIQPEGYDEDVEAEVITKEEDFLYKGSHVILIAKDEEGYKSLTKIMNHSEYNTSKSRMEIPIQTLKDNVAKGHIICTTACITGLFGAPLFTELKEKQDVKKAEALLQKFNFFELMEKRKEQEQLKATSKIAYKGKKKQAESKVKAFAGTSEEAAYRAELQHWQEVEWSVLQAIEELELRKEEFAENDALIKKANKHKCTSKYEFLQSQVPLTLEERQKNKDKLDIIYNTFLDIFGEDFYIELQNHQLPEERSIYNTIIRYCEEKRHQDGIAPKYIQSNDTHICCRPDDVNVEKMINARNVMKLVRMNIYDGFDEADSEYCIKTEEEISDRLRELQGSYFDLLSGKDTESVLTEEIIQESALNTHQLESINFAPKKENHYPAVEDAEGTFERRLAEGIKERFGCTLEELPEKYRERILYEKQIMKQMNVIDYHVIVDEFLRFARYYGRIPKERRHEVESFLEDTDKIIEFVEKNNFPPATSTGEGRGSAAGSLICYCLKITGLDPLVYNLSMERYLNPERVSMPKQYWASTVNPITQGCRQLYY